MSMQAALELKHLNSKPFNSQVNYKNLKFLNDSIAISVQAYAKQVKDIQKKENMQLSQEMYDYEHMIIELTLGACKSDLNQFQIG